MRSVLRKAMLLGMVFAGLLNVKAVEPLMLLPASEATLQRGEIRPISAVHYMGWDGRALGSAEVGAAMGLTDALAAGAVYRDTMGHGRTETRRYDAAGWQAWGTWQPLRATDTHPGIALLAEHTGERIHISSTDATSSYTADPTYAATGAQVRTTMRCGKLTLTAHAGAHVSTLNTDYVATVESAGGQLAIPLGHRLSIQPGVVGYRDNYEGRHVSYKTSLALRTVSSRANLGVEVSLFPRGIPLAGTPLSAASTVGLIYGNSATTQLRTQPMGYISVSGECRF